MIESTIALPTETAIEYPYVIDANVLAEGAPVPWYLVGDVTIFTPDSARCTALFPMSDESIASREHANVMHIAAATWNASRAMALVNGGQELRALDTRIFTRYGKFRPDELLDVELVLSERRKWKSGGIERGVLRAEFLQDDSHASVEVQWVAQIPKKSR